MTVQEIRIRRVKVETAISELLRSFEADTQLQVEDVSLLHIQSVGHPREILLTQLSVSLPR